jgi:hypothetical protein
MVRLLVRKWNPLEIIIRHAEQRDGGKEINRRVHGRFEKKIKNNKKIQKIDREGWRKTGGKMPEASKVVEMRREKAYNEFGKPAAEGSLLINKYST